ncbi:hypothetical protein O181_097205 [Austropuccinia psidii MF-1]|uniref:Uncharacterized protein n=1 Tax=Austropuccinia psidii MF-1 TaxID=1389203 RepID=A0A9Q3J724_9BASI|nr:hypothetical protein [Austropuccinia psidii MF-1]
MEPIFFQRQGQEYKELVEKSDYFIHRPKEGVGNDPNFGERRPSSIYQLQKSPTTNPTALRRSRKVPRTIREKEKERKIGKDLTNKGTESANWNLQL